MEDWPSRTCSSTHPRPCRVLDGLAAPRCRSSPLPAVPCQAKPLFVLPGAAAATLSIVACARRMLHHPRGSLSSGPGEASTALPVMKLLTIIRQEALQLIVVMFYFLTTIIRQATLSLVYSVHILLPYQNHPSRGPLIYRFDIPFPILNIIRQKAPFPQPPVSLSCLSDRQNTRNHESTRNHLERNLQ